VRRAALLRYAILDTPPEPQFDRIVELAARMFDAPMATISFSDGERVRFKAKYGLDFSERPRQWAFSARAIDTGKVVVVTDTAADPLYRDHPHVVGGARIRFHAAAPIFAPGMLAIGAVCIMDGTPRPDLPADRVAGLEALARLVEAELERRLAERQRQQTIDDFRDLAEVSAEWTWQTDAEHRLAGLVSDLPHMAAIGTNRVGLRRWDQPDTRPLNGTWADHIATLEARREFRGFEYVATRVDGSIQVSRVSGRPRFDAGGTFLGYRGTGVDVTQRYRAEMRLRESEESFRYLFERNPNPMFLFEQEGLRFVDVNEAACALYGHDKPAFLQLTLLDIRPEEDKHLLRAHLAGADWNRRAQRRWRHVRRDGTAMDVIVNAGPMTFRGRACQLVQVRDVTEELRAEARAAAAEERQRQSQRLEAIGQLTGGIAHDFNDILSIMMLKVENALEDLPDDEPCRAVLAAALAAGARGADLAARMMTFARKRSLAPRPVDIGGLVDELAVLLRTALSRGIPLAIDVARDAPLRCCIDRTGLETAILNLALNARDAMPGGGELRIAVTDRTISEAEAAESPLPLRAGRWVEIAVRDTGTGMPPEVMARVFEPFFTTKAEGKGTGLGLAMVHGFVHQSGGFVTLASAVGQGTTFGLCLPALDSRGRSGDDARNA
jgi:PAS domain S-box-containing protein